MFARSQPYLFSVAIVLQWLRGYHNSFMVARLRLRGYIMVSWLPKRLRNACVVTQLLHGYAMVAWLRPLSCFHPRRSGVRNRGQGSRDRLRERDTGMFAPGNPRHLLSLRHRSAGQLLLFPGRLSGGRGLSWRDNCFGGYKTFQASVQLHRSLVFL